jgi:hypothetical protein
LTPVFSVACHGHLTEIIGSIEQCDFPVAFFSWARAGFPSDGV